MDVSVPFSILISYECVLLWCENTEYVEVLLGMCVTEMKTVVCLVFDIV